MAGMDDGLVKRSEEQTGKTVGKDGHKSDHKDEDVEAIKRRDEEKRESMRQKALGRGHSTPDEVGEFARQVGARRLVVNHFSAMSVDP
jgi:ribonuclease Z